MPNHQERPRPLLACMVNDGRLDLAPARGNSGVYVFWASDDDAGAMIGEIATLMDCMRGWRSILAGRAVLRCCAGYSIREDKYRPEHWFVATLTGMVDDFELADNDRELWWFDPADRQPENGLCQFEPEVQAALLARATARRASAEATLRNALTRTPLPAVKPPVRRRPAAAPR
jgi:hypothetical protein